MFLLLTFQSDNMRHELPHCTEPLLNGTHIACVCVHSSRGRSSVFPFNLCVESALVGPHNACVCIHSSRGRSSVPFNLCVESALVGPHNACVCIHSSRGRSSVPFNLCVESALVGPHIACVCVHSSRGRSSVPFNLCVESALVGPHIACVCTCPQLHCGKGTEMGIREEREGIDVIGCLIMHSVTGGSSGGIRDQLSSLQAHFTQFSSTLGSDFNLWNDWFALVF